MDKSTENQTSSVAPNVRLTDVSAVKLKRALDMQTDQLDFSVQSALNQRRQIALALIPARSVRDWRISKFNKIALPTALAFSAAALAITFLLRSAQPVITDSDAALLADFDSFNVASFDSALPEDSILNLNDDEFALMREIEFYVWLDQRNGILLK